MIVVLKFDYCSVSVRGSQAAEWDKKTWAPLENLAQNHPEAGVHFQGLPTGRTRLPSGHTDMIPECEIRSRAKDAGSPTALWFAELLSPNPWFKDTVPNVRIVRL